jgi:ankyrin repeat protein
MATYDHEDWYEAERLHHAAGNGDLAKIERLVSAGYDVGMFDDMGWAPLHHAAAKGQCDAVEALLRHGADVNANDEATIGETPLSLAVQARHVDLVRLLLASGADPDIEGWMRITARDRAQGHADADAAGQEIGRLLPGAPSRS